MSPAGPAMATTTAIAKPAAAAPCTTRSEPTEEKPATHISETTALAVDDRVEIYLPRTGSYWGYITAVNADTVDLDDIAPANGQPSTVGIEAVRRIVHHGRRPEGHVGRWDG